MAPEIVSLPTADVHPNPMHYRKVRADDVDELAASLEAAGLIEPITVYRDGDVYIVDAGHHRLAAAKKLGWETIDAQIIDDDEQRSAVVMVASNKHFPETETERSRGAQLLLRTGVRPADAAAMVGADSDKLERLRRVATVSGDEVAMQDVTLDQAVAAADFVDDAEAFQRIIDAGNRWPIVVAELKREHRNAAQEAAARALLEAANIAIVSKDEGPLVGLLGSTSHEGPVPEGAAFATLARQWDGVRIHFYSGDADADEDTEIEATQAAREELVSAEARRIEYIASVFMLASVSDYETRESLKSLATRLWESGAPCYATKLHGTALDDVATTGLIRMLAAVLAQVNQDAQKTLAYRYPYLVEANGDETVALMDVLIAGGYEPLPAESEALTALRAALEEATYE